MVNIEGRSETFSFCCLIALLSDTRASNSVIIIQNQILISYDIDAVTFSGLCQIMSVFDVCRRQILTSKVDPLTVRIKIFIMTVYT